MGTEQVIDEIRELNMTYLILAQNLIRADRADALYRLGLSEEAAEQIAQLSTAQLLRIAASNLLMCKFRFDDQVVWGLLTGHGRERPAAGMHASIVMAGRLAA